jgi:hypothetical protein
MKFGFAFFSRRNWRAKRMVSVCLVSQGVLQTQTLRVDQWNRTLRHAMLGDGCQLASKSSSVLRPQPRGCGTGDLSVRTSGPFCRTPKRSRYLFLGGTGDHRVHQTEDWCEKRILVSDMKGTRGRSCHVGPALALGKSRARMSAIPRVGSAPLVGLRPRSSPAPPMD